MKRSAPILALVFVLGGCAIGLAERGPEGESGHSARRDVVEPFDTVDGGAGGGQDGQDGQGDRDWTAATCPGTFLTRVEGDVRDLGGRNVADALVQLCVRDVNGVLHCLAPTFSDSAGVFVREIDGPARCIERVAIRAMLPDAPFGTTYCPLDLRGARDVLSLTAPIVLVGVTKASAPPLGREEEPRWVTFPGGLELRATPSALHGAYEELVGAEVAPSTGRCFLEPRDEILGLWVFGPEADTLDAGFAVRIPERTGLPEGTAVELLVLGGLGTRLLDGSDVEEAEFVPFGRGTVRGGFVHSDPENDLPYLSWLGYRRAR